MSAPLTPCEIEHLASITRFASQPPAQWVPLREAKTTQGRAAYLLPTDPEMQAAWAQFPDPKMDHQGESLRYMGSSLVVGQGWRHCFRHQADPETHARRYWHIPATTGWHPEG